MEKAPITLEYLCSLIDHTQLKAFAQDEAFEILCKEAKEHQFAMVAINSAPVKLCKRLLQDSSVHVGAAISFPLGQTTIEVKEFETKRAIAEGADEIDYVIHIGALKDGKLDYIEEEMRRIVEVCRANGVISKVIFENCYLTRQEKISLCQIAKKIKPDFIKTSTGFGTSGATAEDVKLMKEIVGDEMKVKASGGIRTLDDVLELVGAGAERIGTSSGLSLVNEYKKRYNIL